MLLAGRTDNQHPVGNRHAILPALGLVLLAFPSFAQVYDVASDFSPTSNPAGAWSYGWSTQLVSDLDLYSFNGQDRGIDIWDDSGTFYPPTVSHNGTTEVVTLNPETITYQPGQFALHPGPGGEYSHARWTAPAAGTYDIVAEFSGIDLTGTTTDVHVLHNTSPLFAGSVNGYGDISSLSTTIAVDAGDFIDFAVGYGGNGYWDDSTALAATISDVTAVDDDTPVPNVMRLVSIHPNPFNPQTTITFTLARPQHAEVAVYDLTGKQIAVLAHRAFDVGDHSVVWNGSDTANRELPSGTYVVRLETESGADSKKVMLLR